MRGMAPEQLESMVSMAESLHSGTLGAGGGDGSVGAPPMDPAVAVDVMRNLSPEQVTNMAKAAADAGMMPPGMEINPDMLKVCSK